MMRENLDMPEDTFKRFMQAATFEECMDVLKAAFPDVYPDIKFNQLSDEINRHLSAVAKKARGLYDPPGDPKGFARIPYKK